MRGWARDMKRRKGQPGRDIVVIGTSAGGVETLPKLFEDFSADIRAAFFVVIHVQPNAHSYMPAMLNRASRLSAEHAQDKGRIEPGKIYVAPPDHHILIERGQMRLSHGRRKIVTVRQLTRCFARLLKPIIRG
jgi:two-component system chemotaxis response regulator CheB